MRPELAAVQNLRDDWSWPQRADRRELHDLRPGRYYCGSSDNRRSRNWRSWRGDHLKIGNDAVVGGGAGVASNLSDREIYLGMPAIKKKDFVNQILPLPRR